MITILSGAGLSAESGLKTFRDADGLWENYDVMEVCSSEGFLKDREKVLKFYDERRAQLKGVKPNLAHEMIARVKGEFGDKIMVLTQNVDDLSERAGCVDVVHLHGDLVNLRCEKCGQIFRVGYAPQSGKICPKCGSDRVRHNVVMFGEMAPEYATLYACLSKTELFICIGSSGEVLNVAGYAKMAKFSILNNLEKSHLDGYFTKSYAMSAVVAAKFIEKDIRNFIEFGEI